MKNIKKRFKMYKTQNWNNVRTLRIEYLPCRAFIGDAWPWPFKSRDTTVETSPRRQLSTCPVNLWNRQILIRFTPEATSQKESKNSWIFHKYSRIFHRYFMDIGWSSECVNTSRGRVMWWIACGITSGRRCFSSCSSTLSSCARLCTKGVQTFLQRPHWNIWKNSMDSHLRKHKTIKDFL